MKNRQIDVNSLTQISSVQSLVREPYLEPATFLRFVELRHGQAGTVDCYRVTNVAIIEDGRRVRYCERAPSRVVLNGGHGAHVLNLSLRKTFVCDVEYQNLDSNTRRTRPVNMATVCCNVWIPLTTVQLGILEAGLDESD